VKITQLNNVSVITNFVIRKRDKKNKKSNNHHTVSSTADADPKKLGGAKIAQILLYHHAKYGGIVQFFATQCTLTYNSQKIWCADDTGSVFERLTAWYWV